MVGQTAAAELSTRQTTTAGGIATAVKATQYHRPNDARQNEKGTQPGASGQPDSSEQVALSHLLIKINFKCHCQSLGQYATSRLLRGLTWLSLSAVARRQCLPVHA